MSILDLISTPAESRHFCVFFLEIFPHGWWNEHVPGLYECMFPLILSCDYLSDSPNFLTHMC